jgi:hypothetical protein
LEHIARKGMQPGIEASPGVKKTAKIELNLIDWGRNGFDGIESLCEGVSGSELP